MADDLYVSQHSDVEEKMHLPDELPGINIRKGLQCVGNMESLYVDTLLRMGKLFESEFGGIADSIRRSEDHEETCRRVHTLKGLAGTVGAEGLALVSSEVEIKLRDHLAVDSEELEALQSEIDLVGKTLSSLVFPEYERIEKGSLVDASCIARLAESLRLYRVPGRAEVDLAVRFLSQNGESEEAEKLAHLIEDIQYKKALKTLGSISCVDVGSLFPPEEEGCDKKTVLVVDDEPINIHALSGVLRDKFEVLATTEGLQVPEVASGERMPDVILLDILMPDANGYEVCRQLKGNPLTRDIPVIFLSAKSSDEDEVLGFEAGGVDYIIKPFNPMKACLRIETHATLRTIFLQLKKMYEDAQLQNQIMVRREKRVLELKDEVNSLLAEFGRSRKYGKWTKGALVQFSEGYSEIGMSRDFPD